VGLVIDSQQTHMLHLVPIALMLNTALSALQPTGIPGLKVVDDDALPQAADGIPVEVTVNALLPLQLDGAYPKMAAMFEVGHGVASSALPGTVMLPAIQQILTLQGKSPRTTADRYLNSYHDGQVLLWKPPTNKHFSSNCGPCAPLFHWDWMRATVKVIDGQATLTNVELQFAPFPIINSQLRIRHGIDGWEVREMGRGGIFQAMAPYTGWNPCHITVTSKDECDQDCDETCKFLPKVADML